MEQKFPIGYAFQHYYVHIKFPISKQAAAILEEGFEMGQSTHGNRKSAFMLQEMIQKKLPVEHWIDSYVIGGWMVSHMANLKNLNDPNWVRTNAKKKEQARLLVQYWTRDPTQWIVDELKDFLKKKAGKPLSTSNMRLVAVDLGFEEYKTSDDTEAKKNAKAALDACKLRVKSKLITKQHLDYIQADKLCKKLHPKAPIKAQMLYMVEVMLYKEFYDNHQLQLKSVTGSSSSSSSSSSSNSSSSSSSSSSSKRSSKRVQKRTLKHATDVTLEMAKAGLKLFLIEIASLVTVAGELAVNNMSSN